MKMNNGMKRIATGFLLIVMTGCQAVPASREPVEHQGEGPGGDQAPSASRSSARSESAPPESETDGAATRIAESQAGGSGDAGESSEGANDADRRFREAMQRFDHRLDRERFGAAAGGGNARSGGGGHDTGGSDASGGAGTAGDQQGMTGTVLAGDQGGDIEDASGPEQRGGVGRPTRYEPPPDIPDGSNDDIVARQLREAAEREPDPELRARLWEEYRAYKNDQGNNDQSRRDSGSER